jgi:hypothetical protein
VRGALGNQPPYLDKQIQIGGEKGNEENGGREFIREFREFPRILRAGKLNRSNIQLRTPNFESCNPKWNLEIHRQPRTIWTIAGYIVQLLTNLCVVLQP